MNQPVKHQNSVAIRCKLLLASNWPPNSSVASKNQLFPQWQAQRTFFGRPWAQSASAARLCGFFHRPPTAFDFRHLPLTSKTRQFLKIRWANHPCGFDPRHRHHRALAFASARSGLFRCAEEDTPGDVAEGVGSRGGKGASHPSEGCGRRPLRKHHSTKPGIHRSQTDDAHLRIVC